MQTQEITDTVVAAGTLALALTTWGLARRTKQTVDEAAATRRLTLAMALDSARTRLDASAPRVDVELHSPAWPPHMGVAHTYGFYRGQATNDGGHKVFSPDEPVALVANLLVRNTSDRRVRVVCDTHAFFDWEGEYPHVMSPFLVPAGGTLNLAVQRVKSVAEWKALWDAPDEVLLSEEPLHIQIDDLQDNGVTDSWTVRLTGRPVRRGDRLAPTRDEARLVSELGPRVRTYFLSRSRGEQLPPVEVGPYLPEQRRPRRVTFSKNRRTRVAWTPRN